MKKILSLFPYYRRVVREYESRIAELEDDVRGLNRSLSVEKIGRKMEKEAVVGDSPFVRQFKRDIHPDRLSDYVFFTENSTPEQVRGQVFRDIIILRNHVPIVTEHVKHIKYRTR